MLGAWELRETDQGDEVLVVATRDDDPGAPDVELEVVGWRSGRPIVQTVTVRKLKGVATRDIHIPLQRFIDELAGVFDFVTRSHAAPQRRELTSDFLASVLEIYEHRVPGVDPVAAVQAQHGGSRASVYRWLAEARKRREAE